jgi:lysophospholipase L1-like esterase
VEDSHTTKTEAHAPSGWSPDSRFRFFPEVNLKFSGTMTYRNLFRLFLLAYLCWEIYWYRRVGLYFVKWHTHLMLYFFTWYLLDGFLSLFYKSGLGGQNRHARTVLAAVFLSLAVAEGFLLLLGIGKTYMEKMGGTYASVYASEYESRYRTYPPDSVFVMDRGEFIHRRKTNALGFADSNWDTAKASNEIRVMVLGDSFTEGVGAEQHESYPAVLQRLLQQEDSLHLYKVMNAGIQGSDPCVNAVNFKERLKVFRPDLILQTLSSNDLLTDIAVKGGMERWQPDSTIRFRPGPAWEPLFAMNLVFRLGIQTFLGLDELMRPLELQETELRYLKNAAADCLNQSIESAKDYNARMLILLLPNSGEIQENRYFFPLDSVLKGLKAAEGPTKADLLPEYFEIFKCPEENAGHSGSNQRDCIGFLEKHYWPIDGHHNSKGYELLARIILPEVKKQLQIRKRNEEH